jgi:hypothetical protein
MFCEHFSIDLQVIRAFSKELNLPMKDVRRLMSEADENEDGLIDVSPQFSICVLPATWRERGGLICY